MRVDAYGHHPGRLAAVLDWVDPHCGLLRSFGGAQLAPPDPAWWVYTGDLARAPYGNLFTPYPAGAAGTSIDPDVALRRALGEAVERYSALHALDYDESILIAPRESGIAGLFPACARDEACPASFRGLPLDTPIQHVMARRLNGGTRVAVPTGYAHLRFWPKPPEPPVTLPISTGLCFSSDQVSAIWGGLCEVAERDAMMLTWWLKQEVPEIICLPQDVPWPLADRQARLERVGMVARFFDITSNFRVPTVFCILLGPDYPYATVGAACRIDAVEACSKALDECVSVRTMLRARSHSPLPSETDFSWVKSLEDHLLIYAEKHFAPGFEFLLNGRGERISFAEFSRYPWWSPPEDEIGLQALGSRMSDLGLSVLWLDVTAPEARSLGCVVKVIVPEMVPLSQDHNIRWLATPRLLTAAGLRRATVAAFNPLPHPFA